MQQNAAPSTLEALFNSLNDLGTAIHSARDKLVRRSTVPEEVLVRLRSYDTILAKQRELAFELCKHIQDGDIGEVERTVKLINGLSKMIRDDAKDILSSVMASGDKAPISLEDTELLVC